MVYNRAVDRNYIYYEPKVVNMLNKEPPTSEEIEILNLKKYENEKKNMLKKQIQDEKTLKIRRSILNYNSHKNKEKCLSSNNYCLFRNNSNYQ